MGRTKFEDRGKNYALAQPALESDPAIEATPKMNPFVFVEGEMFTVSG